MVSTARSVGVFLLFIGIGLAFFAVVWTLANALLGTAP